MPQGDKRYNPKYSQHLIGRPFSDQCLHNELCKDGRENSTPRESSALGTENITFQWRGMKNLCDWDENSNIPNHSEESKLWKDKSRIKATPNPNSSYAFLKKTLQGFSRLIEMVFLPSSMIATFLPTVLVFCCYRLLKSQKHPHK